VRIEDFVPQAREPSPRSGQTAPDPAEQIERLAEWQATTGEPWVLPLEHLSASSLNLFLRCARSFQQQYILKREQPVGSDLVLGSAVHGAIAWNALNKDYTPDEAADYFAEFEFPSQVEDTGDRLRWDDDQDLVRTRGALMVKTYCEQVLPRLEVAEIERRFELDIPGVPIPVLGFVDITQKGTRPSIDIKTSKDRESRILPHWLLQGKIYQVAERKPIDWHVLTKQVTPQAVTSLEAPMLLQAYSDQQAERTRQLVEKLAWEINHLYATLGPDDDWPWNGIVHTWACGRCAWKGDCPGWEGT